MGFENQSHLCTTLWSIRSLATGCVSTSQYFGIIMKIRIVDIKNKSILWFHNNLTRLFSWILSLCPFSGILWCPGGPLLCSLAISLSNYPIFILLLCFLQTNGGDGKKQLLSPCFWCHTLANWEEVSLQFTLLPIPVASEATATTMRLSMLGCKDGSEEAGVSFLLPICKWVLFLELCYHLCLYLGFRLHSDQK